MPLSHVTKVFAAKDCKLFPLTADPAGGAPTYGAAVDVPGIKTVEISGDVNSVELRGDNTKLDSSSTMSSISVSIEFAKLSLDVLSAVFDAATTDSGTTPNQKSSWLMSGDTEFGYVGLAAKAVGADTIGGDVQFVLHKLVLSSFPDMGLEEEDYKTTTLEFEAIPLLANGKWISVELNETATELVAPA